MTPRYLVSPSLELHRHQSGRPSPLSGQPLILQWRGTNDILSLPFWLPFCQYIWLDRGNSPAPFAKFQPATWKPYSALGEVAIRASNNRCFFSRGGENSCASARVALVVQRHRWLTLGLLIGRSWKDCQLSPTKMTRWRHRVQWNLTYNEM